MSAIEEINQLSDTVRLLNGEADELQSSMSRFAPEEEP